MNNKTEDLAFLFTSPETGQPLRITNITDGPVIEMESEDGKERWKHTIKTEEL